MKSVALVFLGGGIGASLRHLLGGAVQGLTKSATFPWGTFAVNVSGCFAIGLLAQLAEERGFPSGGARTFVFVGVLGGYTTFSTFSLEVVELAMRGAWTTAAAYGLGSLVVGVAAAACGILVGRTVV